MLLISQKKLLIGLVTTSLCVCLAPAWSQTADDTELRPTLSDNSDDNQPGASDDVVFDGSVDPDNTSETDPNGSANPNDPNLGGLRDTSNPFTQLQNNSDNDEPDVEGNSRARRADQVGSIGPDGSTTPLANTRMTAEQGGAARSDTDPYAPIGIRMGTFTLFPVITQTLGYTSNADFTTGGAASGFSFTDARLTAVSDWSIHQLRAELGGNYQTFFNGTSEDLPAFDANMELRLDHNRGFTSRIGTSYSLTTESAVSDNLSVPPPLTIVERPDVKQYAGFVELAKQTGKLNTTLRGTVTYSVFDGADLSNGKRLTQGDRTNTLYEALARVGYEISPALQPFVEATLGSRQYFRSVDRNGNRRNSMIYGLRGGVAFDRGEKLNGELSAGYQTENYDDTAIESLSGLTIDGTVNWSPLRLTTFTANAQTAFTGSTNTDEAGSVTYAGTLGVVREIRPNLSLNASILASLQSYQGSGREDTRLQAQVGAEWRINLNLALIGSIGHEILRSSETGSSYDATTARLGLRWQH